MNNYQKQIDSIKWFHYFDKETFGFETQGIKGIKNIEEIKAWGFTSDLFQGKTVLDIGAWDGYNSFYAEKCGAKRVLAIDHPAWSGKGWGTKDGFNLVHEMLDSRVESLDIDLYDISPENIGTFDIVLFLGVLYHLPEPLEGLRRASAVSKNTLIVETTYTAVYDEREIRETDPLFIDEQAPSKIHYPFTHHPNSLRIAELFNNNNCEHKLLSTTRWNLNKHGGRVICYAEK